MAMPKATPGALANTIADGIGASRRLLVKASTWDVFADFRSDQVIVDGLSTPTPQAEGLYDFIAADLPLGLRIGRAATARLPGTPRMRKNWADIYSGVQRLAENGLAMCTVEPAFWSIEWTTFLGVLASHGVSFVGAFRFIEQTLPGTSLEPCFAVFSRQPQTDLFVADVGPRSSLVELVDGSSNTSPGRLSLMALRCPWALFGAFNNSP
jgi:hypothetical protein